MLTKINLRNFKCFDLLRLPLSPLTILSGTNASGKSSILQALVLLKQIMREHEWSTRLTLNGDIIRLGTVADVVDEVHGRDSFEIGLEDEGQLFHWKFCDERDSMSMAILSVSTPDGTWEKPEVLRYLLPPKTSEKGVSLTTRIRNLTYLTAERLGPREMYVLEDKQDKTVVDSNGANATSILHAGREESVLDDLILYHAIPKRLNQVKARMQIFFPDFDLDIQPIARVNAVGLGIRTSSATDYHRPIHEGFGLTQVFPIVVAALSAARKDILLIENPEVHLHPAGQTAMGNFLANVARAGVQVIVETHSDHVLSGVRRAVKGKRLAAEQVSIHFFQTRTKENPQVISPALDNLGNIDSWPEGFFDQFDKDMRHFAGWDE